MGAHDGSSVPSSNPPFDIALLGMLFDNMAVDGSANADVTNNIATRKPNFWSNDVSRLIIIFSCSILWHSIHKLIRLQQKSIAPLY
jgi:hypothetical protein